MAANICHSSLEQGISVFCFIVLGVFWVLGSPTQGLIHAVQSLHHELHPQPAFSYVNPHFV